MYSLGGYGKMVADEVRMRAFIGALRDAIEPGSVVLDIGTGTGVFALLASRLGARRVYAIEPDQAALAVARELATINGVADRIEFIAALSTEVSLPERADVMVSDLHGVLPLFKQHIPSIIDARSRLLAPGGAMLPARDRLQIALVEAPEPVNTSIEHWLEDEFGVSLRAADRYARNTWRKARLGPDRLLTPPACWGTIDYASVQSPDVSGDVKWTAGRAGVAHGLAVWFDATIGDGHGFSNAPGEPGTIYGQGYFPLQEPVALECGDAIAVSLSARLAGATYVWLWSTTVHAGDDPSRLKARFRQSTFLGTVFVRGGLDKVGDAHVPVLNEDGLIERTLLELMDGTRSMDELGAELSTRFPARFESPRAARRRVDEASSRFSRNPA
ncbi:MAG: 50S ribosomal protein L11 methyltransferase [Gemmatimonadetes bacterium]|nr:50S ribosomal protein L11 methyltransferase [Gemmatimonadota bacterium]